MIDFLYEICTYNIGFGVSLHTDILAYIIESTSAVAYAKLNKIMLKSELKTTHTHKTVAIIQSKMYDNRIISDNI